MPTTKRTYPNAAPSATTPVQLQAVPYRLFISLANIDRLIIFVQDVYTTFCIR